MLYYNNRWNYKMICTKRVVIACMRWSTLEWSCRDLYCKRVLSKQPTKDTNSPPTFFNSGWSFHWSLEMFKNRERQSLSPFPPVETHSISFWLIWNIRTLNFNYFQLICPICGSFRLRNCRISFWSGNILIRRTIPLPPWEYCIHTASYRRIAES